MDRQQLLLQVLLVLAPTACQQASSAPPTTILVEGATEAEPSEGDPELPARTEAVTRSFQPEEANAGCTQTRYVPEGFDSSRFSGCPQRLQRASASVFDGLKSPRPPQLDPEDDLWLDETLTERARQEGDLESCCYRKEDYAMHVGRPLRWRASSLLPGVLVCAEHIAVGNKEQRLAGLSPRLQARDWLRTATHEHAASASFIRLVADLLALGAPRDLAMRATAAARDELRHAELALDIAGLQHGRRFKLAAIAIPRLLTREAPAERAERVAREFLLDAALGEGVAALEAWAWVKQAQDPALALRLERLAGEETQHALLGWRGLRWLVGARPELAASLPGWLAEAKRQASATRAEFIHQVVEVGLEQLLATSNSPRAFPG